jgi:hypothetical protein
MGCSHDYNLERSILYILKNCCPGTIECAQIKGAAFHPLAPYEHASSFVTRGRYNVQTSDIMIEPVKVNLLDTSGLKVDHVISFHWQSDFHTAISTLYLT